MRWKANTQLCLLTLCTAHCVKSTNVQMRYVVNVSRLWPPWRQISGENREKDGVNSTESGLQFRVLTQGEGAIPARTDRVRVHYTGKLIDGTVFDSSVARGEPAEFPVNGVIPGWIEALTLMPVGSKWELTIPHNLAYGERGAGASIPPFSTLVFEVELLEIL